MITLIAKVITLTIFAVICLLMVFAAIIAAGSQQPGEDPWD